MFKYFIMRIISIVEIEGSEDSQTTTLHSFAYVYDPNMKHQGEPISERVQLSNIMFEVYKKYVELASSNDCANNDEDWSEDEIEEFLEGEAKSNGSYNDSGYHISLAWSDIDIIESICNNNYSVKEPICNKRHYECNLIHVSDSPKSNFGEQYRKCLTYLNDYKNQYLNKKNELDILINRFLRKIRK